MCWLCIVLTWGALTTPVIWAFYVQMSFDIVTGISMKLNLNFKILSLNVRGSRSFDKRKALFHWLSKEKSNIIFLQETYSTPEVENIWKSQWRGDIFFSHGSEHSRGVMILLKEKFDCEVKVHREDEQGRFVILKSLTQSQPFVYVNIYAPNKVKDQCIFSKKFKNSLMN